MSASAKSVFYFGLYIALLGVLLIFFPNTLLGLVNVPPTDEVWIRLAGMLCFSRDSSTRKRGGTT